MSFLKSMFMKGTKVPSVIALTHLDKIKSEELSNQVDEEVKQLSKELIQDYSPPLQILDCVPLRYLDDKKTEDARSLSENRLEETIMNEIENTAIREWV